MVGLVPSASARWVRQIARPDPGGAFHFNLRFPGQYYDTETGLAYNFFRDYDAGIGRYVESDPIGLGGGVNTFGYVGGNPLSYTDESGLFFTSVDAACAQDPAFCADVMGQVQQNNADMARAQGNCAGADALQASANALNNIGTALGIAQLGHAAAGMVGGIGSVGGALPGEDYLLQKSLASEEQIGELLRGEFEPIAGAGTSKALKDAPRLVAEYGGELADWAKVSANTVYKAADGFIVETHAYWNSELEKLVEIKSVSDRWPWNKMK